MIRVALVDDHPLFRTGMESVLNASTELELVGSAESVAAFDADPPESLDLVLLDMGLPELSGAAAVAHMVANGMRVLVISASSERDTVVDAIASGAGGYLSKSADPNEVLQAIRTVAGGGTYVSPTLASYLLHDNRQDKDLLTPREREILELVADGETDRDIAELLTISPSTVASHLDRIRDKTGRRRRAELTRYAFEHGIAKDT